MINVLLADDHHMFIDGMKAMLEKEKDIKVVGDASNGDEVLSFLEKNLVDVVVLDIEMPETNGIETAKIIRKEYPKVKVLILSMYNKKTFILELMKAGAAGYILKDKSKEELIGAIYNVYKGQPHFGLEILSQITLPEPSETNAEVQLSEREIEVLCLIAEGMTTKEVSKKLFISEATVNTHRRNLLQKIEVPNDKFLVRYAIKHKLVDL